MSITKKLKKKSVPETTAYLTAKEILTSRKIDPEILRRDDLPVEEYVIDLVIEALNKLSLVRTTLHYVDDEGEHLMGNRLTGCVVVVDEVQNLLKAAENLHTDTH